MNDASGPAAGTTGARPVAAPADLGTPISVAGIALLITLTFTWGLNWPLMKLTLLEVPPWTFRSICLMGGGSVLLALALASGGRMRLPAQRVPVLALVSLFNITGWHLCSAYALLDTGAGRAAIIGYTMPLWAAPLSVWVLGARVTAMQVIALALGMAALVLLIGDDLRRLGEAPRGALLMVGAALSWAIGTVLVKKLDWGGLSVLALTGWQQLLGGLPIVLGWWLLEPWPALGALSPAATFGLTYAVLVAMVFCHTAYFKLVALLPAHVAAISVLAVPVVGVVSSALIIAEPVGAAEVGALALVVAGLFLLVRAQRR